MQISTRTEDFIIDTLKLRNKMQILNNSFTDSNIVKVLHGSDSDIVWLQRDFGIYIVNLFDTGQASRVLGILPCFSCYSPPASLVILPCFSCYSPCFFVYCLSEFPKFSLAFLLSHFCGINVDKKYQLADWRIR
jgi:exosome complex exonuclease RRP6